MKPRFGGGSKGIRILERGDLQGSEWLRDEYIYQHFDDYAKEYTAVVMKDGGRVAAVAVLERALAGGRTVWCKRVAAGPHEGMLKAVASGLDIPYLNIQFGMVDGMPHVFDLNPRFSGSTAVFALIFNGPDLLVQKALHGVMPDFLCGDRYFESVRFYDDLVVDVPQEH